MASKTPKELMEEILSDIKKTEGFEDIDFNGHVQTIPTGIDLLDYVMGGGVPVGKLCTITGSPGGGKTTLAAQYIVGFQHYNPESMAFYIDIEQGLSIDRLVALGCDPDRTILISNSMTVEVVGKLISSILASKVRNKKTEVPYIIIWDSESATPTTKALEATDASSVLGEKSRAIGILLPKLVQNVGKCNTTLIIIAQLRNNITIDRYAPKKAELNLGAQKITGGSAAEFLPFQLAFIRSKGTTSPEAKKENCIPIIGQANEVLFKKNKNFTPNIPIELVINYDSGYEDFWSKERLLRKTNSFKGAAWQTIEGCDVKHRRGDVEEVYNTNPEFKAAFDALYEKRKNELLRLQSTKKEKEIANDLSEEEQKILEELGSGGESDENGENIDLENL